MSKNFVEVDGSLMEGGGSIVRLTTALSILTEKPVRIYNIRKGREQPGLRNQHLRGLEASADLCGGRVEGAKVGATAVFFYPGKISGKHVDIVIDTAGSTGLVLQSLLIASLKAKEKTTIGIKGGATFGKYAPPLQYIQFVLLPLLRRMGYHAEININRHGFYPVGGAVANVMIEPPGKLEPLTMDSPGKVTSVDVISIASSQLKKPRVAERQVRTVEEMLRKRGYELNVKMKYSDSRCAGSGVLLVARTENGSILGADGLGERGKPAEEVAGEAVKKLLGNIDSGAAVDEYMSDQILPYMAMASGKSTMTAPVLTSHAETNMHILKQFLNVTFDVETRNSVVKIGCR